MMGNEYRGNWYLPNSKEIKIPGILSINRTERKIFLKLLTEIHLDGTIISDNLKSNKIINSIILGEIYRPFPNKKITIFSFDGFSTLKYEITHNMFEITYEADYLFVGEHFEIEEAIRFEEFWLQYNNLPAFMGNQSIFGHDLTNFQMEVNRPDEFKIEIGNSNLIEFVSEISASVMSNKHYQAEAKHFIKFSNVKGNSFKQWRNLQSKIHGLLFLSHGGENSLIRNFGVSKGEKIEIVTLKFDGLTEENISHSLFKIAKFKRENISLMIKNWFDVYDTFEPCISVFLYAVEPFWKKGSKSIYHINFTNSILNVVQAIEAFYKKDSTIDYQIVKNEFSADKDEIIKVLKKSNSCLTSHQLKFVNNNLRLKGRNKNEAELAVIINYFLQVNKDCLSNIIAEDKFSDFTAELKNLRNTLTHINHDSSDSLTKNKFILFNVAQSLFLAILMNKIGFSQEEIKKMIENLKWF